MARTYPAQPMISCHGLIRKGGQVLLVRRARPPFTGYWSLPGGTVELGETAEGALAREIREETSLTMLSGRLLGYADTIDRDDRQAVRLHYLILYFEVTVAEATAHPGDDADLVAWMEPAQIRGLPHTDSVDRCLHWVGI